MNDDEKNASDEIHSGYEFEEGMFSRMRSWVDVAPWLRLARVLRILASPAHVGIVFLASLLSSMLFGAFGGVRLSFESRWSVDAWLRPVIELLVSAGWISGSLLVVGLTVLWMPVLQTLCRSGASLTADRGVPAIGQTLKLVLRRLGKSYLVALVPLLCVAMFCLGLVVIRLPSLLLDVPWISWLTGGLIGLLALPVAILAFGAIFAVPLGSAAMVCETDPDPIDSLSRGYEYLFRRPLPLVWYLVFAGILVFLVGLMLGGVGFVATVLSSIAGVVVKQDVDFVTAAIGVIAIVIFSWKVTFAFSLLGGIYLLLRHDANGQHVEDFWQPPEPKEDSLPKLPPEAYQT